MQNPKPFPFSAWSCPEEAGVSSAGLLGFLDAFEKERSRIQFHSMILLRNGKTVFSLNFAPYDVQTPHVLYSMSKPFTSAAAAFAVQEGKLSWDSSVVDILPEDVPFHHANELTAYIRERTDLCIGGACYPECHPEAANKKEDIANIRKKVEAGCDFLTTQMFFDNSIMYNYLYRLRDAGIEVPVCAGIMPVTNIKQVETSRRLSGCIMPAKFTALVDRFGDRPKAMAQAGIAYATEQIIDLIANGVNHIHVYSMNKPFVARAIRENLSDIIVP